MRAIIVGGGIAGPAAAMALQRVGVDAIVLEAAEGTRVAGSWFTVAPNGLAALGAIEALDPVRALGIPTRHNLMRGATGRELGRLGLGGTLDDGTPALSFRRPDLAAALGAEAQRRGIQVRYGARVAYVHDDGDRARVTLRDGTRLEGDLVIGADGIHSVVRTAIDPDAATPRYLGLANFGGISPGAATSSGLPAGAWTFVFGRRAFFGALPTPDGDVVWFVNEPRPPVTREERSATSPADWLAHLGSLAEPDHSGFTELIAAGELELAGDATYDLPRVRRWHRGRLGLIGDALHAPAPSSGQGASMALEDAVVLARCLRDAGTPPSAFAAFEAERRRRVERIVAAGARSSSSKTAGPVARVFQDAVLRWVFRHLVNDRSQAWVYGERVSLDAEAAHVKLNSRG
ncbi:FAD-dependent monooxygenase [Microbacterium sp. NPDC057407]|uniref:FAD-dependent monooxygenase n=1 Tax=Microbacterium sp. NPDC057407 TaxID=3346120 RepID=UPI00367146E9